MKINITKDLIFVVHDDYSFDSVIDRTSHILGRRVNAIGISCFGLFFGFVTTKKIKKSFGIINLFVY